MDHLLNLARAAKLVGVSRGVIQSHIKDGGLRAFEGSVRVSELSKIYPDIDPEEDAVLERMHRIQDNALYKINPDEITNERVLANQVHRLQVELTDAYAEIGFYQNLSMEMRDRLIVMKETCARREKQILQALLVWMNSQMKQHT